MRRPDHRHAKPLHIFCPQPCKCYVHGHDRVVLGDLHGDAAWRRRGFATCNSTDTANIFVRDITQIGDANGNPLDSPIDITSTNPALASQIAAAFGFSPNPVTFNPGEAPVTIMVTISNPGVDPSAYGVYDVNLAAKDQTPGSAGIGVASGSDFILHLIAPTNSCTDTTNRMWQ